MRRTYEINKEYQYEIWMSLTWIMKCLQMQ
jgi:hypothetical protein